jgi:signal peptidase I
MKSIVEWLYNNISFSVPAALMALTVFTGTMWLLDLLIFSKKRKQAAEIAIASLEQTYIKTSLTDQDKNKVEDNNELEQKKQALREKHLRMPWWLDYSAGFFGVVFMVFVLRSFIAEPFRIPSASMMPTLQSGDLILVNKFSWGVRMPVFNKTIIETGSPDRGDVIVFRFPQQPSIDFIKRVVGLPGDTLEYNNKVLTLNGKVVFKGPQTDVLDETGEMSGTKMSYVKHFIENLPKKDGSELKHSIFNNFDRPSRIDNGNFFTHTEACIYIPEGIRCIVPKGHYFVMGDNRDNSHDSRWWGFVPEDNIVGNAFFVWMNLGLHFNRIGSIR